LGFMRFYDIVMCSYNTILPIAIFSAISHLFIYSSFST
jgi:hypothetical protein